MNKKNTLVSMLFVALILISSHNITYGKYSYTLTGEAWKTAFSIFGKVDRFFVIESDKLDTNGEAESDSLWGGGKVGNINNVDSSVKLDKLKNVDFHVSNLTTESFLVTFDISYYNTVSLGFLDKNINTTITNIVTGGAISSKALYSPSDGQIKLSYDSNDKLSGGFLGVGGQYVRHYFTINPLEVSNDLTLIETSFVLEKGESASFNLVLDYGTSPVYAYYSSVSIKAIPYKR